MAHEEHPLFLISGVGRQFSAKLPAPCGAASDSGRPHSSTATTLFHFSESFDDGARRVAFASGALLNGFRKGRFDSAQLPQFCLNLA